MKVINMKKILKSIALIFAISACASAPLFAQDISLPDVTTVVSGENVQADDEALPDFADVLILPQGSGTTVPLLQDVEEPESSEVKPLASEEKEKSIYAEGLIGGGFPTLFIGDFSLFRQAGNSPFKLSFSHDSAIGYSGESLTDSYSDRTTSIALDKSFKREKYNWGFGAAYNTESNGLQNKIDGISSVNQNLISGIGNIEFKLPNGFFLGADGGMNLYNRYSDISSSAYEAVLVWARKNTLLGLNPRAYAKWAGYGFTAGLSGLYTLSADLFDEIQGTAANRGQFTLDFSWANDFIKIYSDVSIVLGNKIGADTVIVPFTLGIESSFPVYFSNRRFSIFAEGGLDSYQNSIYELEQKYTFSALSFFPTECSDWYAKLGMTIPLKESFNGAFNIEYRGTAFDNGVWEPVYDSAHLTSGLYGYAQTNRQLLTTDFNLAYHYKIFSVKAGWQSNWIYVPVLQSPQALTAALNFQSQDSAWGAELSTAIYISNQVTDPVINLECFARLTSAVRIVGSVEDIIKLFKGEQRLYAGQYAARGGTAKVMLKFFF